MGQATTWPDSSMRRTLGSMGRLLVFVIPVAITIYAFIDVLGTKRGWTRRGPKWLWLVAVVVLPIAGPLLWFVLGKPYRRHQQAMSAPDDDLDFLRNLRPEDFNR